MKSKNKMTKVFVWCLAPIVLVLMLLPQLAGAQAAIFTVNSTADTVDINPGDGVCADGSGLCTLRAAIMEANALPGADTIVFAPSVFNVPKTITLSIPGVNEDLNTTGDLDITSDLIITGVGANMTAVDGGGTDRVFDIRPVNTNVHISGLTVTHGSADTITTSGGGILAQGALLTLTSVTVRGNTAGDGGGIFVGGPVILNNSTVSGNSAFNGGGISNYINGPLTLNNSTVSGNSAPFGAGIGSSNHGNTLILNNSTVSDNVGHGLRMQAGTVIIKNTILANNTGGNCATSVQPQLTAALISLGHNLSTDIWCEPAHLVTTNVSGGLDQPTDLNNTPAQLAPLALNPPGGTQTHALLPGSPAIDAGGLDCSPTDQRGIPRPQGAACDIGAYEVGTAATAPCVSPPPGLKAWWPLDETTGTTAADIIGGHNGTALPGPIGAFAGSGPVTSALWPPPTFPPGMVSTSLFFDGNRRVEVPHNSALEPGTGDFTIDAWVIYAASGNGQLLTVAQKNTGATAPFGNTFDGWRFVIRDSSLTQGRVSFRGPLSLGSSVEELITPNTWHHVSATLSTTNGFRIVKVYVDGVSFSQIGLNGDIASPAPLLIGGDGIDAGQIAIDEVEIFNRALTQQEIQAIFNAGSAGKCLPQSCPTTITCPANIVVDNSNSPGQCSAVVNYTVSATASCSSATVACSPSSGSVFPKGTTTVHCTVSDASGNSSSCSFTVTVNDTLPPAITCPANVTQSTDPGICSATVNYPAQTASDNCPGVGAVTCNPPSGSSFPKGTNTVNCTVSDASGNTASCSFTVTVNDTQAPTVTCLSNVTVNTSPNQCSAAVNYPAPTADNCPGVGTPICSHLSGSTFPKGTTTVTCTATDASGNTGSCSFRVTVIPPQLTALSSAKVWIGLRTIDDVGTKFDLLAEVLKNGTVVGTGQRNGVPGGSSGFNNAVLNTITLALSGLPVDICAGDTLAFKLSVRVAANSGHSSGTARLWYNDKFIDTGANRDAGSRFNATIGGGTANYFLRTGVLNTTAGSSRNFIDVPVNRNVGGNPFKPFGIWSITF